MVLGEDKHSWGSQLLNNSERDSQHSVRGGALSGQLISLQSIGGGGGTETTVQQREGGRVYKDSMREKDMQRTVEEFAIVCIYA